MRFIINEWYRLCTLFLTFSLLCIPCLYAQKQSPQGLPPEVMAWTISTIEPWPDDKYKSLKDAMIDNKIFPPLVFRGGVFPKIENTFNRDSLRLNDSIPIPSAFNYKNLFTPPPMFSHYLFLKSLDSIVYRSMLANPKNFKYTIWQLPTTTVKSESIDITKDQVKIDVKKTVITDKSIDPTIKFIPDRKYWTSSFAADIKFSQNKSSANWHKGEINNLNIYTNTVTTYNYIKNKVSLTNILRTTFTVSNAPNDMLRKYAIGTDEFSFRSNLGLKAIKNWNYSGSGEFITSMGNKYIVNKEMKSAAFLSPFTVNAGLGMTYSVKPKFNKPDRALDLSLSLEPLSFKYMYSIDTLINLQAFFPKDENGNFKRELKTFGSTIKLNQTSKIGKNVILTTRFDYFTNYERVISEFENKLDIILSRYFSTTIHLYLRYDDGVVKKEDSKTHLQVNEFFSFGFSYRW